MPYDSHRVRSLRIKKDDGIGKSLDDDDDDNNDETGRRTRYDVMKNLKPREKEVRKRVRERMLMLLLSSLMWVLTWFK